MNPVPKPVRKPKSPRPPTRKSAPRRKSRIKPKPRSAEDFARVYHSVERVKWVQSLPCQWCVMRGRVRMCGPTENAHTVNEGLGRKGHYSTIAPLGRFHHQQYDQRIAPFDKPLHRRVVASIAEATQSAWLRVSGDAKDGGE